MSDEADEVPLDDDPREPVYVLAERAFDHEFPYGVELAGFRPGFQDVPGRRHDGTVIGVRSFIWGAWQMVLGVRWLVLFVASIVMVTEMPLVRGDVVRGKAGSGAVKFADAARRGSRLGKVWLLWSPEQVVLVAIRGKYEVELTPLWSGEEESKPFINTETGEMNWPDGSELQLDRSDEKRAAALAEQQAM